jgi:hypothetical protein
MTIMIFQSACLALSSKLVVVVTGSGLLNLFLLFIAVLMLTGYVGRWSNFQSAERNDEAVLESQVETVQEIERRRDDVHMGTGSRVMFR